MPPPVQATDIVVTNTEVTQADISWTRGSGEKCAVFMKQTDNGSAAPLDADLRANTAFGSGTQIGSTGWFCVYNGTGTSLTVTGLTAEVYYRVMVCGITDLPGANSTITGPLPVTRQTSPRCAAQRYPEETSQAAQRCWRADKSIRFDRLYGYGV